MYLWEMKDLPRQADKARLDWDKGLSFPQRDRSRIGLPFMEGVRYFPLLDGKQFIVQTSEHGRTWFGGTDEEPFLVEMNSAVADHFVKSRGSVSALYEHLVPEPVLSLAKEVGTPYRRQGDIFAARFSAESQSEDRLASLLGGQVQSRDLQIFGTRHTGKGRYIVLNPGMQSQKILFRGVVEAPDHAPMNLSNGLYLLGQTRFIVNPVNAD